MQIIKTPATGKKTPSFWDRLGLAPRPEPTIPASPAKPAPANNKSTSSVTGKAGASVGGAAPRVTGSVPGVKGTTFPNTSGTAKAGSSAAPVKSIPAPSVTPSASTSTVDPLYIPNEAQKQEADVVAKLPSEFPIFQWESMGAIAQQKVMEKSGLSPQDQWRLLNASTPLDVLSLLNEIQNNAKSGLLTSGEASKITDQTLRYSDDRLRLANGDASYLPPLQKALWNRELDKVLGDLQDKANGNTGGSPKTTPRPSSTPLPKPGPSVPVITPAPTQNGVNNSLPNPRPSSTSLPKPGPSAPVITPAPTQKEVNKPLPKAERLPLPPGVIDPKENYTWYNSYQDAAEAWALTNRGLSKDLERCALIYRTTDDNGNEQFTFGKTKPGMKGIPKLGIQDNVISSFVSLYLSERVPDSSLAGFIHTHPSPPEGFTVAEPSKVDLFLLNLYGIDYVTTVPYENEDIDTEQ